jgi:hypothetical protein
MKNIIFLFFISMLWQNSMSQAIRSITDINNRNTSIDSLKGTKLLIIVVPSQTDTAISNQLLRFQKNYAQKVKVIALVPVQTGTTSKELYAAYYDSVSQSGVIVSEGIAGTEMPDNERASMIQWLSGKSNDRQQDRFVTGSKYFLSEEGRLYAQLGIETSLDDPLIKCIINTNVPAAGFKEDTMIKKDLTNNPPLKSQLP